MSFGLSKSIIQSNIEEEIKKYCNDISPQSAEVIAEAVAKVISENNQKLEKDVLWAINRLK